MRFYISDLHYFHFNMLSRMDCRGFENLEEMHEYMISKWNDKVGKNDEVVIVGDLSFGNGLQTNEVLKRLKGKKFLVEGNHDHRFLKDRNFDKSLLTWVKPYIELNDNRRKVILCHYPTFCYNGQYRKDENGKSLSYMVYGHVHNTKDGQLIDKFVLETRKTMTISAGKDAPHPIPCNMINCFCMFSDYVPLTLDEWIALNEKRMIENVAKL